MDAALTSAPLVLIPAAHAETVWPLAEPHLRRALLYSDGEFTLEETHGLIRDGRFQLWLAWDGGTRRAIGAGVTEIFDYPRKRVCFLVLWASEAPRARWLDGLETVERWAREQGCDGMRLLGRKGWGRVLSGYRPQYTVFVRSFDEERIREAQPGALRA
jgi:hypothetical protein